MYSIRRRRIASTRDWRHVFHDSVPVLVFATCLVTVVWMWGRASPAPPLVGEVEVVRIPVAADVDGILREMAPDTLCLFDSVEKNQIVARLDDRQDVASLEVLQRELARLQSVARAAAVRQLQDEEDRQRDHSLQSVRLLLDIEERRLAIFDRGAQVESDRLELQRQDERLKALALLVDKQIEPRQRLTDERLRREQISVRLEDSERLLTEAVCRLEAAVATYEACAPPPGADIATLTAPLAAAIEVQSAKIHEAQTEIDQLLVRSPARGTIAAIHHWPGEYVKAGEPILSIAPIEGRCVVAYLRQELRAKVLPGDEVLIRPWPSWGHAPVVSSVLEVGPQLEVVPPHHLRDPRVNEWGVPIRVTLPGRLHVRPGELVEVTLRFAR